MGEKRSELSSVYYFFPFTTTSELEGETLSFDERLIFTKSSGPFPTRNLMRSDVKTCIESIKHYRLDKDIHPTLKSYCFLRDENNRKTNKVVLANLSDILILHTISIYSFDKENQFLVLHCYFKDEPSKDHSYQSFDMEKVIRAHGHFVNNVFKSKLISLKNADGVLMHDIEPELVVQDEPYNVLEGWETHDSFITLAIGDKEYTFSGGKDSLPEITGFKFEFKDYQVHYLSRLYLYEDNLENRYSYAERLSGGSMRTYMQCPENNALDTKRYTAMFSYFGSSIISFKPDELDIEKDKEEIEYLNEANKRLFLHELFYDFLIAINYRIRIKRQILDIGKINYNDNSPQKLAEIRKQITKYSQESALYYFENVSQFNSINEWFKKLLEGLGINDLCDELETKLKDADTYISYTAQLLKEKRRKKANITAYIFSTIVGTVLAIFSLVQAVYAIENINYKPIISIVGSILLTIAAVVGCFVILKMNNKLDE